MAVNPLVNSSNSAILNAIRDEASPAYQARIPATTRGSVKDTLASLDRFTPHYNEAVDTLINRIGTVLVRNQMWDNPLAMFKGQKIEYGDTIQEVATGLIKGKDYNPDRVSLEGDIFGKHDVPTYVNYHRVNRREHYDITVNRDLLRQAFLTPGGLESFINNILSAPVTSAAWDEFLLMTSLFPEYEKNGGFHHVRVPDASAMESDSTDAKSVLRTMRSLAGNMTFMSTKYNAAGIPQAAKRDEMVVFCTPEFNAAIDVEAMAGAFNMERAQMPGRIIEIPKENFGIDGAQALITTDDFFVVQDQLLENTTAQNPLALHTNYFMHVWQAISASRFTPAVLLNTEVDDAMVYEIQPVTGVSDIVITDRDEEVVDSGTPLVRGELYQATAEATGEPDADRLDTGVIWSVSGTEDNRTHVSPQGVISVGPNESDSFTLHVFTSWTSSDMSDMQSTFTTTRTVTVTGEAFPEWPVDHGHEYPEEPVESDPEV